MKIFPSGNKVTFDKIDQTANSELKVANITELVMDKEFIEQSRHDWCWLSWENIPQESGWYVVERSNQLLTKVTGKQVTDLEWHERLFVYESALSASKEKSVLALYIGDEYKDGRLSALYLCGPDVLTWVALSSVV